MMCHLVQKSAVTWGVNTQHLPSTYAMLEPLPVPDLLVYSYLLVKTTVIYALTNSLVTMNGDGGCGI